MITANQIFDLYRDADFLTEEDCADFLVLVQDTDILSEGIMAITGLTLSLLEKQWSKDKMLLLMKAYHLVKADELRERIIVGLLMVMMKNNVIMRENPDIHDMVQDILTDVPELSFTALCNIARTSRVKYLEKFNQQMAQDIMPLMDQVGSDEFYDVIRKHQGEMEKIARLHLDQNFLIFKTAYYTDFFRAKAVNCFLLWDDKQLLNVAEEEREQVQEMINIWPMCDSDKYALIGMSSMIRNTLKSQIQGDALAQIGDSLGQVQIVTNAYVQQLYRYFRLSSFAPSNPFELVTYLRDTWVYRLVVVGNKAKKTISELLS